MTAYNIIIIDGYQYLEEEGQEPILIFDDNCEPLKEDITVKRWVKTGLKEYTLVQGIARLYH